MDVLLKRIICYGTGTLVIVSFFIFQFIPYSIAMSFTTVALAAALVVEAQECKVEKKMLWYKYKMVMAFLLVISTLFIIILGL